MSGSLRVSVLCYLLRAVNFLFVSVEHSFYLRSTFFLFAEIVACRTDSFASGLVLIMIQKNDKARIAF